MRASFGHQLFGKGTPCWTRSVMQIPNPMDLAFAGGLNGSRCRTRLVRPFFLSIVVAIMLVVFVIFK